MNTAFFSLQYFSCWVILNWISFHLLFGQQVTCFKSSSIRRSRAFTTGIKGRISSERRSFDGLQSGERENSLLSLSGENKFKTFLDRIFATVEPFQRGICDERISLITPKHRQLPFQEYEDIVPNYCRQIIKDDDNKAARPVFGITRGMGCGKSRLLEEMRLYYDQNLPEVLCIAITYNTKGEAGSPIRLIPQLDKDPFLSLLFSVIVRMLSVFYNGKIHKTAQALLSGFDFPSLLRELVDISYITEILLEGTILHLVERYEKANQNSVKHFILAIDEAKSPVSDIIKEIARNQNKAPDERAQDAYLDLYNYIRSEMLDSGGIAKSTGIVCHLVMSSLDFLLIRKTPSLREVVPLECGKITASFVVDHIWKRHFDKFVEDPSLFK